MSEWLFVTLLILAGLIGFGTVPELIAPRAQSPLIAACAFGARGGGAKRSSVPSAQA